MPVDKDLLRSRINDVRQAINDVLKLTSKPYEELDLYEKYAIRYNIITLTEAFVSICIHIASEAYNYTPSSYREAIKFVAEKIGVKSIAALESMVKLRNLLVHRYWSIDDEKIYKAIKEDFKCVETLINIIEREFLH
ncbi:MAG: type VII toxin-antitoxin system HepT family RNase toxin [Candidatus Nezhaarchaeales archaeon]